ncbi:hypothetical protein CH362_18700 [Leptospira saintgironsiae]|uniref:YcxB-like protein domain-containing protein n=1 Tax=Leptospira saintgironsiae TaxID=2023183 RepID=A0A2M9Y7H3_9LEPT|nr:hypothetical protein CH362_18700 [Leptospira saintgironsiae]
MRPTFVISFTLSEADIIGFNVYHYKTASSFWWRRNLYWITSLALAIFMIIVSIVQKASLYDFILLWILSFLLLLMLHLVTPLLIKLSTRRMLKDYDNSILLGEREIAISGDRINIKMANSSSTFEPNDIKALKESASHIYLYIYIFHLCKLYLYQKVIQKLTIRFYDHV